MESTASVKGHPIHPMLIPYPFALLSSALAFDVGASLTGRHSCSQTARQLTNAGLATALVAAVPGIIDYFGTVPSGTSARRTATQHGFSNVSALACFAMAQSKRRQDGSLPAAGMALALLGTGLLSLGGWLGGHLVYHEHIAVVDDGGATPRMVEAGEAAEAGETSPAPMPTTARTGA
jgi:uncharacterized membrane protein